jgi:hypothetical protein
MDNQETLEEAAENAFNDFQSKNPIVPQKHIRPFKLGFANGTKWQAGRMYSPEELKEICTTYHNRMCLYGNKNTQEWFEQFKKKES